MTQIKKTRTQISGWKRTSISIMTAALLIMPVSSISYANQGGQNTELGKETVLLEQTVQQTAEEVAQALLKYYGAKGVQYAIRDKGNVVLSGGMGVTDEGKPAKVKKDTMFAIGSVSKMYVTAATMMLVEDGVVDLDQPLTTYLPSFKMADDRYKQITPRMLMNHSSGLYGSHYKNSMLMNDNDTQNHDSLLANLSVQRLKSNPGAYSVYANDGFQLLELLVEEVSGLSYTDFVAQRISQPLGLKLTKTPLDNFDRTQLYPGYFPGITGALLVENANVLGTGGLYATAEELTRFGDVLIGNDPSILSEASAQAMQQPEYHNGIWVKDESNSFNYGLGWDAVKLFPFDRYGIQALTKGGDTLLYHSALVVVPEQNLSIAVLTSGGSSIFNTNAASRILLAYMIDKGIITKQLPDLSLPVVDKAAMPASYTAYSGHYGAAGEPVQIKVDKNGEVAMPAMFSNFIPAQSYAYIGEGDFAGEDGKTVISFEKEGNGLTYVRVKALLDLPGLGQALMAFYEYQKLEPNKLSEEVKSAWEARDGQRYYALDEKINSLFYLLPSILTRLITVDLANGYAGTTRIVSENKAINALEIPVMNGRDVSDLQFSQKNGAEYLEADGRLYLSEAAIRPIYSGASSIATIQETGHARWFHIGEPAAGRTIQIASPVGSGFAVYDADGILTHYSVPTGIVETVLPEGGTIVFGGKPGDVFQITLQAK